MTTNQSDRAVIWYRYDPAEDQLSEFRLGSGLAERCLHHEGRNLCVLRGSLPSDPTLLQRLFACTADEFASGWTERVAAEFPPDPANPGRLINQWACSKIAEVVEYRARQAANGAKGGRRRVTPVAEPPESERLATVTPVAEPPESERLALQAVRQLVSNTGRQTQAGDTIEKPVENFPPFEPGEFDLPAFFERLYDRHPKKSNRNIALRYLEEALRSVSPEELEAGHNAWCECEQWQDGGGRYVKQDLAQWILDQGWKYSPPGNEDPNSAKSLANEYQR